MSISIGRRGLLRLGAGAALAAGVSGSALASVTPSRGAPIAGRSLSSDPVRKALLHNLHTGETFNEVYFENGRYVPQALAQAMRVMRDWRNGQEHFMDPRLFDALHAINSRLEINRPFQI